MQVIARWGVEPDRQCGYFHDRQARCEILLVDQLSEANVDGLLEHGYRHFGRHFFRPYCQHCTACIPIKVRVDQFKKTRSVRKTLNRARHFDVRVTEPRVSREAYRLFLEHKERFGGSPHAAHQVSYEGFERSFFYRFSFSRALEIWDGDRLAAVSHFDLTHRVLSAIYCYYGSAYSRYSPGRLAIYHQLRIAEESGIPYVHLGYYIKGHKHMSYKARFRPNEILLGEEGWVPFMDSDGNMLLDEDAIDGGFRTDGTFHPEIFTMFRQDSRTPIVW